MKVKINEKGQAVVADSVKINQDAFDSIDDTEIIWLGSAGIMINTQGTVMMIDPVLEGFDMPLLYDIPMISSEVPKLDALLITHIDNDHFSRITCKQLRDVCHEYHSTQYVASEMNKEEISGIGHDIHDTFKIKDIEITLTPALHNWQSMSSKYNYREWKEEEYCGYWIKTNDGTIWLPGDSKLLDEHLQMPSPDMILFDFADNEWHITFEGAVKLANTYPDADLLCIHWGCVDAPNMTPFNGNPEKLIDRIVNPERIIIAAPGEKIKLKAKKQN